MLDVAVIGAGRRGRRHAEAISDLEGLGRVVGVADVDEARVRTLVAEHALHAAVYTDALVMLRETNPAVVVITSPPPLHNAQTLAALESGAHVILEKPITLDVASAEALAAAATAAGRLIHVCHQSRYLTGVPQMRELLRNRPIALTQIWNYRKGPDIPGNWNRAWGGGHVVEWGIHYLDLCRYLMDTEPVEVYARYADQVLHGQPTWDNWDSYSLTVQWANGAVGSYGSTYALAPGITSSAGLAIIADGGKFECGDGIAWTTPTETTTHRGDPGEGERELARAFFHAVETGDTSGIRQSFDDALKTHRLVLAANESASTGKPVRL